MHPIKTMIGACTQGVYDPSEQLLIPSPHQRLGSMGNLWNLGMGLDRMATMVGGAQSRLCFAVVG